MLSWETVPPIYPLPKILRGSNAEFDHYLVNVGGTFHHHAWLVTVLG